MGRGSGGWWCARVAVVLVVVIVRRFLRGCLVGVVLVELWRGCLVGVWVVKRPSGGSRAWVVVDPRLWLENWYCPGDVLVPVEV